MNVLVTGANGQLGREIRAISSKLSDNYIFTDVCGEDIECLDIRDLDAIRRIIADRQIGCIINCAAFTNVDAAEDNYLLAEELNAQAPQKLAVALKESGGFLIHISTDYVFGLEPYNSPCREDQTGTPTGVYGLTKLHGEQNILASGCDYMIFRTAWLYSSHGKNFCKTILNLISSKPQIKVVFDQAGTPTFAGDLAEVITDIIERRRYVGNVGVYNYSNEGVCSWFDFAKAIAQISGNDSCGILPCHSSEFPSPVRRPAYSVLDKTKIKETFGITIPYWRDSLEKLLKSLPQL